MISSVMLGLGRALGETMAVAMVLAPGGLYTLNLIGNENPNSIAGNIARRYKEGTPGTVAVLIATGLVLFVVTFLVNFAGRWIAGRADRKMNRWASPPPPRPSPPRPTHGRASCRESERKYG